jgi:hypothetical protein
MKKIKQIDKEADKSISVNELRLIELRGFLMGLNTLDSTSCYYHNFVSAIDNILDNNNEEIRSSKYKLK